VCAKVGRRKNPADLQYTEIIRQLSKTSGMTIKEITEPIELYTKFIADFLKSPACPKDVKIPLPNLGKFSFKQKRGLKVGDKYKAPLDFGATKDENGKIAMQEVVVTEDYPDYQRVWFDPSPQLQKEVKFLTSARWRKNNG